MIRAILLAAGQSKRLKGENKLVRKFKNKPLISYAVNSLIKSKISKCLNGKIYPIVNGSVIGLSEELYHVVFILVYSFIDSIPASLP